jgi:glycerol uptake facilitator protein
MFVVAVIDLRNTAVKANLGPFMIGLAVFAIGLSYGANAGYAINPARDFGPRLFAWIAGWGKVAMPGDYANLSTYLWIPIVGPIVGGLIGAFVYDLGIRDTLRARGETPPPDIEPRGRTVEAHD